MPVWLSRWFPFPRFPYLRGLLGRPSGSQRRLSASSGRAGGSRRSGKLPWFSRGASLSPQRRQAAFWSRLRAHTCCLYRTQFYFCGFLGTVRSPYRAHTPIEGLFAIIDDFLSLKSTGCTTGAHGSDCRSSQICRKSSPAIAPGLAPKYLHVLPAEFRLPAGQGTLNAYACDPWFAGWSRRSI